MSCQLPESETLLAACNCLIGQELLVDLLYFIVNCVFRFLRLLDNMDQVVCIVVFNMCSVKARAHKLVKFPFFSHRWLLLLLSCMKLFELTI